MRDRAAERTAARDALIAARAAFGRATARAALAREEAQKAVERAQAQERRKNEIY